MEVKKHEGQCTFQSTDGAPNVLSCTLGCGAVLQMSPDVSAPSATNMPVLPSTPKVLPSGQYNPGFAYNQNPRKQHHQQYQNQPRFNHHGNPGTGFTNKQKRKLKYDNWNVMNQQNKQQKSFNEMMLVTPNHNHQPGQPYFNQQEQFQGYQSQPIGFSNGSFLPSQSHTADTSCGNLVPVNVQHRPNINH